MKLFNHTIEVHTRGKWPITHMRLHKSDYYSHFVWGRLSLIFGQSHLEPVRVCAECREEIGRIQVGDDDYICHCSNCRLSEGDTLEITMEEYERGNK